MAEIEKNLKAKAKVKYRDIQLGDIYKTHASVQKLKNKTGYTASTDTKTGIKKFIDWYKVYFLENQ